MRPPIKTAAIQSVVAFLAVSSLASAGAVNLTPVVIVSTSFAYGSVNGARFSPNTIEEIGCYTEAGPNSLYGYCYARNSSGVYLSCLSRNPRLVAVMATVTATSQVAFTLASNRSDCAFVGVRNASLYVQ